MTAAAYDKRTPPSVRAPILAGRWYPEDPDALATSIHEHLSGATRPASPPAPPLPNNASRAVSDASPPSETAGPAVRAIIVPHAGHEFSGACAAAAFRELAAHRFERLVLLGPSHFVPFSGLALPEESAFATPLGRLNLDDGAVRTLLARGVPRIPAAHRREHCLEIELPFVQIGTGAWAAHEGTSTAPTIVPLLVGSLDEDALDLASAALEPLWDDRTVVLVSTDFTHCGGPYEFRPFVTDVAENLARLDGGALDCLLALDEAAFSGYLRDTGITICGAEPLRLLLRLCRNRSYRVELCDYYRSGDFDGDYEVTVSYAALVIREGDHPFRLSDEERAFLIELARTSIASATTGAAPRTDPLAEVTQRFGAGSCLHHHLGCFVTLHDAQGELRGCIGTLEPRRELATEVIENAVAAATRDPRFPPVRGREFEALSIELSVLTPYRRIATPGEIELGRDGVLLRDQRRKAVFLPEVPIEQGWDVARLVAELRSKAGLPMEPSPTEELFVFQSLVLHDHAAGGSPD